MNTYTAKLDNGEGGETELQAKTAQEALAMAMAWAAKGDWSDPNPNHLGGVLVSVENVANEDDEDEARYFPEQEAAR
jgi:hypothetical protein